VNWNNKIRRVSHYITRGVGTGGGAGGPRPPKFSKVPFFQWQSALCLRDKCCSDCIFACMAFDLSLHLFFLPPVANFSGKNFLGALFILKSAPRNRPSPQLFDASYAPVYHSTHKAISNFFSEKKIRLNIIHF
jgi:hypothetical protein